MADHSVNTLAYTTKTFGCRFEGRRSVRHCDVALHCYASFCAQRCILWHSSQFNGRSVGWTHTRSEMEQRQQPLWCHNLSFCLHTVWEWEWEGEHRYISIYFNFRYKLIVKVIVLIAKSKWNKREHIVRHTDTRAYTSHSAWWKCCRLNSDRRHQPHEYNAQLPNLCVARWEPCECAQRG